MGIKVSQAAQKLLKLVVDKIKSLPREVALFVVSPGLFGAIYAPRTRSSTLPVHKGASRKLPRIRIISCDLRFVICAVQLGCQKYTTLRLCFSSQIDQSCCNKLVTVILRLHLNYLSYPHKGTTTVTQKVTKLFTSVAQN